MDRSFVTAVRKEALASRNRRKTALIVAAVVVVAVVVVVGVVAEIGRAGSSRAHTSQKPAIKVVQDVKDAPFDFLVPGVSAAWTYDAKSLTFDADKGVMKYGIKLNYANTDVTISQQRMPAELGSRETPKFKEFIVSSNVVRSQQAGNGTVYFIAMMQNGAQAPGADAVIYATNDILMFGKTGSLLGYDAWTALMDSMSKQSSK
jgi:hypothetical protein